MDTATVLMEAGGRWAVYLAALPLLGLLSCRWLLWPRAARAAGEAAGRHDRRLARYGILLGLVLLVALGLRAMAQTANAFGPGAAWELDSLRTVVIASRWGGRFQWQVWAACGAVAGFAWVRVHARSGWALAAVAGAALCVALPRTGHALSHGALALAAQALHVLGAGLWIGTLAVAVVGGSWLRTTTEPTDRPRSPLLHSFAPVAIAGAAALGASGALSAYLYLPDLQSLYSTAWGRALLLKVGFVLVVGALGTLNFGRFRAPVCGEPSLRLVRVELGVALAVVLLTGLLTALPSPGE